MYVVTLPYFALKWSISKIQLKLYTPHVSYTSYVVYALYPESYDKRTQERMGFKINLRSSQTLKCWR